MLTVSEIAAAMDASVVGDGSISIAGLAEPASAAATDLALAMAPKFADALKQSPARAAVVWEGADLAQLGLDVAIVVARPRLAMAHLTKMMDAPKAPTGVHPSAIIDPSADIGADVSIGPLTVIGAGAEVGSGTVIMDHVSVAPGAIIGCDGLIAAGARIGTECCYRG